MAYEFEDSFADTAGTALSSHTPTKISDNSAASGSWTLDSGTLGISSANRLRVTVTGEGFGHSSVDPSGISVPVRARFRVVSVPGSGFGMGVNLRGKTDPAKWGYYVLLAGSGSAVALYLHESVGGGFIPLASLAPTSGNEFAVGGDYDLVVTTTETTGPNSINIFVTCQRVSDGMYLKSDGTWQSGTTDAIAFADLNVTFPFATTSKVGVWGQDFQSDSAGIHIDRFAVGTAATGATTYTLGQPTLNAVSPGRASNAIAVEPDGAYTGTITLSDGGAGGSFSPSATQTWTAESGVKNFTYTPVVGSLGSSVTISATNSGSLTDPDDITLNIRTGSVLLHTNSYGLLGSGEIETHLQSLLGGNWDAQTFAHNGQDTTVLTAAYPTEIRPLFNSSLDRNAVVMIEIINDLFEGATATQAYNHVVDYSVLALGDAFELYLTTPTPRTGTPDDATYETSRQTVAASMRTNVGTIATKLVDWAADANIGDVADLSGPYYAGDGVHLSGTTGCDYAAQTIFDQITAQPSSAVFARRRAGGSSRTGSRTPIYG